MRQQRSFKKQEKTATIVQTLHDLERFKYLSRALWEGHLQEKLEAEGYYTLFAPPDDAFDRLPENFMNSLYTQKLKLNAFVGYHVLPDVVWERDLRDMEVARTHSGRLLEIQIIGTKIKLDGAKLILPDILCANGIIHVIDSVMWPK